MCQVYPTKTCKSCGITRDRALFERKAKHIWRSTCRFCMYSNPPFSYYTYPIVEQQQTARAVRDRIHKTLTINTPLVRLCADCKTELHVIRKQLCPLCKEQRLRLRNRGKKHNHAHNLRKTRASISQLKDKYVRSLIRREIKTMGIIAHVMIIPSDMIELKKQQLLVMRSAGIYQKPNPIIKN